MRSGIFENGFVLGISWGFTMWVKVWSEEGFREEKVGDFGVWAMGEREVGLLRRGFGTSLKNLGDSWVRIKLYVNF